MGFWTKSGPKRVCLGILKPEYTTKMQLVYVLLLEQGRFYVGQTPKGRLQQRILEHRLYNGSKWCNRFKYVRLLSARQVPDLDANRIEDEVTIELLKKHGLNRVRGGNFVISRDVDALPAWVPQTFRNAEREILTCPSNHPPMQLLV